MPAENEYTAFGSDTGMLLSALTAYPRMPLRSNIDYSSCYLPWEHFMGVPLYATIQERNASAGMPL